MTRFRSDRRGPWRLLLAVLRDRLEDYHNALLLRARAAGIKVVAWPSGLPVVQEPNGLRHEIAWRELARRTRAARRIG